MDSSSLPVNGTNRSISSSSSSSSSVPFPTSAASSSSSPVVHDPPPSLSSLPSTVARPLDSETFLPPRLSCMQDLRLIATSTRLYLCGRDPQSEPYNKRVHQTVIDTGILSSVPTSSSSSSSHGHTRYSRYISGDSSSSTASSSSSASNNDDNTNNNLPLYRILEFDRTIKNPSNLNEIMMERKGPLYTENQIQSFIGTLLATHAASSSSSSSSSSATVTNNANATTTGNSIFKSFTSFLGGSNTSGPTTPSVPPPSSSTPSIPNSSSGNNTSSSSSDTIITLDAVALLGAIQFMRGIYLVLVTRRECIGTIGGHRIWGIRATELVPIYQENQSLTFLSSSSSSSASMNNPPMNSNRTAWQKMQDALNFGNTDPVTIAESRYTSLFLSLDLTKDFYYSTTYDVTRPLQQQIVTRYAHAQNIDPNSDDIYSRYIGKPTMKYVWNSHLVREFYHGNDGVNTSLSSDWVTPLCHGFFRQVTVSVFGYSLLLTLTARRSRYYAGTRYLKRGVNDEGYVANDVESEQIVDDTYGRFASFVQVRGSIPLYWMQRTAIAVPKPPILLQPRDFTYEPARRHFATLFSRYGGPVLLLNLVKKKERHAREKLIGSEWARTAMILNRELPINLRLQYLALDYAAIVKNGRLNVLAALRDVGRWTMVNTGFFCNARLGDTLQNRRERAILSRRAKQVQGSIPHELENRPRQNIKDNANDGTMIHSLSSLANTHLQLPIGSINNESKLRILETDTAKDGTTSNTLQPPSSNDTIHGKSYTSVNNGSVKSWKSLSLVYVAPGRIGESEPMKVGVGNETDVKNTNVTVNTIMQSTNYQPPVPYIAALSALSAIPAVQIASSLELESAVHNFEQKRFSETGNEQFRHSGSQPSTVLLNGEGLSADDMRKSYGTSTHGVSFLHVQPIIPALKGIDFESLHVDGAVDFNPLANIRTRTSKMDTLTSNIGTSSSGTAVVDTPEASIPKDSHQKDTLSKSLTGNKSPTKVIEEELDNASENDNEDDDREDDDSTDSEGDSSTVREDPNNFDKSSLSNRGNNNVETDSSRPRSQSIAVSERSTTTIASDGTNPTVVSVTGSVRSVSSTAHTYTSLLSDNSPGIQTLVDSLPDLTVNHRSVHDKTTKTKHGKPSVDIASGGGGEKAVLILDSRKEGASEGLLEAAGATEVELRTEAERPYGRTRDPVIAGAAASRCRYVLSCSEQQDVVSSSTDGGALRVGIGVRLREYANVGGVGDYMYVDLQGRHHGYHTGITTRESSRSVYPHLLTSSIASIPEFPTHIRYQEGVLRTNCIDCLDRTNVAQVCVGVHMLGLQLYALGLSDTEGLDPSGPLVRALMELYEAHGDVIAMQYGGSEANKRVTSSAHEDSVRTGAATENVDTDTGHSSHGNTGSNSSRSTFTFFGSAASSAAAAVNISGTVSKLRLSSSGPAEILTSLQRYYSNSFTDSIKQASMNLFLGLWRPRIHAKEFHLWELETDNYLHNVTLTKTVEEIQERDWMEEEEEEHRNTDAGNDAKGKNNFAVVPTTKVWTMYETDKDDPYTLNLKLAETLQGNEWWNKPLSLFRRHGLPKYYGHRTNVTAITRTGTNVITIPRSTTLAYGGAALTEAMYARNEYTSLGALVNESYSIVAQQTLWNGNVVNPSSSVSVPLPPGSTTEVVHGKESAIASVVPNLGITVPVEPSNPRLPNAESKPKFSAKLLGKVTSPSVLQNEAFGDSLFADILAKAVEVGQTITNNESRTSSSSDQYPLGTDSGSSYHSHRSSLSKLTEKPKEIAGKLLDNTNHLIHVTPTQALMNATGIVRNKAEAIATYAMDTAEGVIGRAEMLKETVVDKATNALEVRVSNIVGVALDRVAAVTEAVRDSVLKTNGSDTPLISTDAPDVYTTLTNEIIDPNNSYRHHSHQPSVYVGNNPTEILQSSSFEHHQIPENRLQVYPASTSALDESFQEAILNRLMGNDAGNSLDESKDVDNCVSSQVSADENVANNFVTQNSGSQLRTPTKTSLSLYPSAISFASLTEYPSKTEIYPTLSSDSSGTFINGPNYVQDKSLYESYAALGGIFGNSSSSASHSTNSTTLPIRSNSNKETSKTTQLTNNLAINQAVPNRRIHVVTSKNDIDLFRTSVLLPGNGIVNTQIIDNILQSGIGTMAELATFETKLTSQNTSSSSSTLSATVPPLTLPLLGENVPYGPFRGLPKGRLATPEIRSYLSRNESTRTILYTSYVHQNPLASSGTFYTNSKQINNIGGVYHGEKCDIPKVCSPLIITTGPLPTQVFEKKENR